MIEFIASAMVGACLGVVLMAALQAGKAADNDTR